MGFFTCPWGAFIISISNLSNSSDELQDEKLITILKSKYHWRVKSKGHWYFLNYHYNIKYKPYNLDNSYKIYNTEYDTLNYITHKLEKVTSPI